MKARTSFPSPVPGLVIRYSYLWESEHRSGQEEGRKDRPCAIILSLLAEESQRRVVVLPIPHTPPTENEGAIEIPTRTKLRLGLDEERSWVIVSEANLFSWPGPDLRPAINGNLSSIVYGLLPDALFHKIRGRFANAVRAKRLKTVARSE